MILKIITCLLPSPKHVNIPPMKTDKGQLKEVFLDGCASITCPPELVPAPGQYLLAHAEDSDLPLADTLFFNDSTPDGFRSAPPLHSSWQPGDALTLRGPLGHGFVLPPSAHKVALIALDDSPARLRGLISLALMQNAEVVLVCESSVADFPEVVEIQPLQAMLDVHQWSDYTAMDVGRENLNWLREEFGKQNQMPARSDAQVLVRASMPCGALAECGVCALVLHHSWKMVCRDGPVFELKDLL
jgi:hypothetical protein